MHFLSRLDTRTILILAMGALLVGFAAGYYFGYDHGYETAIAQ